MTDTKRSPYTGVNEQAALSGFLNQTTADLLEPSLVIPMPEEPMPIYKAPNAEDQPSLEVSLADDGWGPTPEEMRPSDEGGGGGGDEPVDGEIVVTAAHYDWMISSMFIDDLRAYQDFFYGDGLADSGFDPGEPTPTLDNPGNGMGSDEAENTITYLKGIIAGLNDALKKYGPGTMADVDGKLVPIQDLLEGAGKVVDLLEAGNLVVGLATGDQGVVDLVQFVFGIAIVGLAMEAGLPIAVAVGMAVVAEKALEEGFAGVSVLYNGALETFNTSIDNYIMDNPSIPTNDPYEFFRSVMGMPSYKSYEMNDIYTPTFP